MRSHARFTAVGRSPKRSMTRPGSCHDKTSAEQFFWSPEDEWTNHIALATLKEAQRSVFAYIVTFSNSKRIHQALGCRLPDRREAEHTPALRCEASPQSGWSGPPQSAIWRFAVLMASGHFPCMAICETVSGSFGSFVPHRPNDRVDLGPSRLGRIGEAHH